jgi:hypothetical protein
MYDHDTKHDYYAPMHCDAHLYVFIFILDLDTSTKPLTFLAFLHRTF